MDYWAFILGMLIQSFWNVHRFEYYLSRALCRCNSKKAVLTPGSDTLTPVVTEP